LQENEQGRKEAEEKNTIIGPYTEGDKNKS